jgi:hypothetical protein
MIVDVYIEIKHHRASWSLGDFLLHISAEGTGKNQVWLCDSNNMWYWMILRYIETRWLAWLVLFMMLNDHVKDF